MSSGTERVVMRAGDAAAILGRFVAGGRLKVIPAKRTHKLVVFAWLVRRFDEGRRYPEPGR